jgi:NAD(P)-dependent dehydrogenase (short-subunit alcohol dehydrogenase family)
VTGTVTGSALAGRRVVVVGASAGIGRAFAVQAVQAGAEVALVARREEPLVAAVKEAGGGHVVVGDICDHDGTPALVTAAASAVGGEIDLVVHAAGASDLRLLADADAETWRRTFEINVVAANGLINAALPYLAPGAIVGVLSSESADKPRSGMVPYAASKAALDVALRGWRLEHPEVRFSCLAVGATQPTEFGNGFDGDLLGRVFADWGRHGLLQEAFMDTDDLAGFLVGTLGTALDHPTVGVEHIVLRSPSPVMGRQPLGPAVTIEPLGGVAPPGGADAAAVVDAGDASDPAGTGATGETVGAIASGDTTTGASDAAG